MFSNATSWVDAGQLAIGMFHLFGFSYEYQIGHFGRGIQQPRSTNLLEGGMYPIQYQI